jgi:hypothetical protein
MAPGLRVEIACLPTPFSRITYSFLLVCDLSMSSLEHNHFSN